MNTPGYAAALTPQEMPDWDPADYASRAYSAFPETQRLDHIRHASAAYAPPPAIGTWNNADDAGEVDEVVDIDPAAQVWHTVVNYVPEDGAGLLIPEPPLPVVQNAGALQAFTPGELAALDKMPRRIHAEFWHKELWQDPYIDGRHVIFPRQPYPIGDGPMEAPAPAPSVTGPRAFAPLTSEGYVGAAEADYSGGHWNAA